MPLTTAQIDAAADALDRAEVSGEQIGLLSAAHPDMTEDDAYAVQSAWLARRSRGTERTGAKIGLTSRAMQQALGIDSPDSGVLFADMEVPDGGAVPAGRYIQPRVEAEIAFILRKPLGRAPASEADVMDAVAWARPSLEILDTRILRADPATGAPRRVVDTIADNAANAGYVLGGGWFRPEALDLPRAGCALLRNGEVEETGLAAGVMGHPLRALRWLANHAHARGETLERGEIILSGSFIRPVECPPGTTITADFGPLGTVSCHFDA
ncbi:MAG: fumarylacetoacetate hydrolase family protein [Pseudomonadota bacterium]